MDRDKRWERVEKAYRAIVDGVGTYSATPTAGVLASYERDVHDEFVVPFIIEEHGNLLQQLRMGMQLFSLTSVLTVRFNYHVHLQMLTFDGFDTGENKF